MHILFWIPPNDWVLMLMITNDGLEGRIEINLQRGNITVVEWIIPEKDCWGTQEEDLFAE
jgi:hypothetical protein